MKTLKRFGGLILVILMITVSIFTENSVDVMAATGSLKLNKTAVTMYKGQTGTLKATKNNISGTIKWSSSNPSVATVSSKGKVTARATGYTYITAKCGGYKARCKVTVVKTKAKVGFYCGGSYNTRRLAIEKISGNKVRFRICYSGRFMSVSDVCVGTLVKDKITFTSVADHISPVKGTIVFKKGYLIYTATGSNLLSTEGQPYTLKWINKNSNIRQIY